MGHFAETGGDQVAGQAQRRAIAAVDVLDEHVHLAVIALFGQRQQLVETLTDTNRNHFKPGSFRWCKKKIKMGSVHRHGNRIGVNQSTGKSGRPLIRTAGAGGHPAVTRRESFPSLCATRFFFLFSSSTTPRRPNYTAGRDSFPCRTYSALGKRITASANQKPKDAGHKNEFHKDKQTNSGADITTPALPWK